MVKIEKGGKRIEVSSAAFHNFYKDAGWELSPKSKVYKPDDVLVETEESDEVPDDEWEEALAAGEQDMPDDVEKPLSQMNHTELIEKAIRVGVDVSDNPSNAKLRERIRNA